MSNLELLNMKEAVAFLGIDTRTLSRYIADKKIKVKKKGKLNYFKKSDLLLIGTLVQNNQRFSSTQHLPPKEISPQGSLIVTDDNATDLYWDVVEAMYPQGMSKLQASTAQTVTMLTLQKSRVEAEIVLNPLDEHLVIHHQRILKSITEATKGINNVSPTP